MFSSMLAPTARTATKRAAARALKPHATSSAVRSLSTTSVRAARLVTRGPTIATSSPHRDAKRSGRTHPPLSAYHLILILSHIERTQLAPCSSR
ncbi:hypothetical protein BD626DRAFT_457776, partial [Schizophyllum amplum]